LREKRGFGKLFLRVLQGCENLEGVERIVAIESIVKGRLGCLEIKEGFPTLYIFLGKGKF